MSSEVPEMYNCGNPECSRSQGAGLLVAEYKSYPPPGTPEDRIHEPPNGQEKRSYVTYSVTSDRWWRN